MRKVTLLLVVLVLAGATLAWVIIGNKEDKAGTPSTTAPTESLNEAVKKNNVEVKYTSDGFSPSTVTVPVGATVVFINNSSSPMWVASDDHPEHNDLAGFDAEKGIAAGQEYEFTFNDKGKWGYHNHLKAADTGTVVVE